MEKSHKVLKKAFQKVGAKQAAKKMNLSLPLIYKWCQEKAENDDDILGSGADNPLDRIKKIHEITQNIQLINWICQSANGFFVPNVDINKLSLDREIFKNTQKLIKEFSETLDTISKAYNNGKKIDLRESKLIRKEWEDLKRVGESFVRACESGKFNKPHKEKTS